MKRAIGLIFLFMIFITGFLTMKGPLPFTTILDDSMEPTLPFGSLLMIKTVEPSNIKVGDIIIYNIPTSVQDYYNYPPTMSHRVTGIKTIPTLEFITKGDNTSNDPFTIKPMYIRGIVGGQIPFLGMPLFFFQNQQNLIFIAIGIAMLSILFYARELLRGVKVLFRLFFSPVIREKKLSKRATTRNTKASERNMVAIKQNRIQMLLAETRDKIPVIAESISSEIEPPTQGKYPYRYQQTSEKSKNPDYFQKPLEKTENPIQRELNKLLPPQNVKKQSTPPKVVPKTKKIIPDSFNNFENKQELPKEAQMAIQEIYSALDQLSITVDNLSYPQ